MLFVKTLVGQEALKERHGGLSPRQRSTFILFDGKRTWAQVLAATAPMGITEADVQTMLDQGLLSLAAECGSGARATSAALPKAMDSGRSDQQRYQDAYPLATEVTASLGLSGFRLNLAVEGRVVLVPWPPWHPRSIRPWETPNTGPWSKPCLPDGRYIQSTKKAAHKPLFHCAKGALV